MWASVNANITSRMSPTCQRKSPPLTMMNTRYEVM